VAVEGRDAQPLGAADAHHRLRIGAHTTPSTRHQH
jgi:hypothetical protein